MYLKARNRD